MCTSMVAAGEITGVVILTVLWALFVAIFWMVVGSRAMSAHEKLAETASRFFLLWRGRAAGKVAVFGDKNIERAVRDALKIPEGPIYEDELRGVITLDCSSTLISDLSGIENCTGLECLCLCNDQISDIRRLAALRQLRVLFLDNNEIDNISALANLTGIGEAGRPSEYEDILTPLRQLEEETEQRAGVRVSLALSNNQIRDISPLVHNPGIGEGDGVDLTGNPLSEESISKLIPQLEQRGVKVLYDKPKGGSEG